MSCSTITNRADLFLKKPITPVRNTCATNRARIILFSAQAKKRGVAQENALLCHPSFLCSLRLSLRWLLRERRDRAGSCRSIIPVHGSCPRVCPGNLQERLDQVKRQREDDGRVFLYGDFCQRLQVAQLQCAGLRPDDISSLCQLAGSLQLTFGVDDLGAFLTLGLSLFRHRALHSVGQFDILDFDRRYFHAPALGMLVDNFLQFAVDLGALRQEFVQFGLSKYVTQGCHANLRGGLDEVHYIDDRRCWINYVEVDDSRDLNGDRKS